ncbi:MAG TPA: ATP-binding protein [Stellaceae bacterium]|nr:ATP-binding protein [Stellaceae bacterium]
MTSLADWRPPVHRHDWAWSSVRPVTLLIASGIVLIAAILMLTGLVAGHLREQALDATQAEMGRLDAVVAASANHSFAAADAVLKSLSERLHQESGSDSPAFAEGTMAARARTILEYGLGPASPFAAIAAVGRDGAVVEAAGWWPPVAMDLAKNEFLGLLQARPRVDSAIGAPFVDPRTGAGLIPYARRVVDGSGQALGYVVGLLPQADFASFFESVPLGPGGAVALVRQDGVVLARYPAQEIPPGSLEASRELADYPLKIMVARNGNVALGDWSHQAMLLGALALLGAIGVAVMVAMIARQFRVYATLAAVKAEKIEVEHARLVTEAELLKKERLSVLGQLTATVAHELRNPLSAIRNTLFSVKEMADGAGLKLDRPIARMERSIERCNRIIGDLLEYARHRELRRAAVDFDAWLKEVLSEQQVPAPIALVEDFRAAGRSVSIDGDRIRRVVINLIDNAAQALGEVPVDGRERRITVQTRADEDAVELKVQDTGPGIPAENRVRIFEPLFSTKSFGTGLGLATVKQIVGQHGGTIEVDSMVGQGTCFTIRLPHEEEVKAAA